MLVFLDQRQININRWVSEEFKKLHNPKFLSYVIRTDEQKEIYNQYKSILEENKHTKDKYIRGLNKIKAENILQGLIDPILKAKAKYFDEYYNVVIEEKRKEHINKMKKKLKTEREIIPNF